MFSQIEYSQYRKVSYKISFVIFLFAYVLLMFNGRFVSNSAFVFNIDVKYAYVIIFFISLVSLFIMWSNSKLKLDFVIFLLFSQFFIYCCSIFLFSNSLENIKVILSVLLGLSVYSIGLLIPRNKRKKTLLFLVETTLVIITLQTIYVTLSAISLGIPYYQIKSFISIPIGQSNYIASFIIMFLSIILNLEDVSYKKYALLLLAILGIIFTRSGSAILLLSIYLVYEFLLKPLGKKNIVNKLKPLLLFLLFILIASYALNQYTEYFSRYIYLFENLFSRDIQDVIEASNGRFNIYMQSIDAIMRNPITGLGINYDNTMQLIIGSDTEVLAHNLVLDLALKAGIFNVIIYLGLLAYIIKKLYNSKNNDVLIKSVLISVIFVIINSLYEPNLGTFAFDFFFWLICGLAMSSVYDMNRNIKLRVK